MEKKKKIILIIGIIAIIIVATVAALQINRYFQDLETAEYLSQIESEMNNTNTISEETTSGSMSPEEQFIHDYDTNGDNLLDSNEFPYSKFEEINSEDISKGLDPYPSIQMLIEDFDIDLDHKLSVDELKNIVNLNL
ncbi:hypothetical protein MARBORIA2_14970 [Methanobrevibacter arboriphilus]|jgi:uncharacterized protein YxeA|uniref:EF-hand domain-containing protein n=1 Tax=Methanobrevibacter arboriphilus TaxID=39441 RepID=UPI0022ED70F8|nr:EF-hand domain-containing protein [Methanobrevibacter arboriphilus]GLI12407.1 hypothetical protein MARBORIA2_14970 [Methanobrevibacter arboriphilus]